MPGSETNTMLLPKELTLIVAATSKMGIGRAGTLPWTGLKKEMAYFARVTKRADEGVTNTVIMGRKTWDSIPPNFRPLKNRTNIIISRNPSSVSSSSAEIHTSLSSALESLSTSSSSGRAFIIGGGEIYKSALRMEETRRILLTRVLGDFECDTFFEVELKESGVSKGGEWVRRSKEELDSWTGESVPEGVHEESGTRYVFEMWERR